MILLNVKWYNQSKEHLWINFYNNQDVIVGVSQTKEKYGSEMLLIFKLPSPLLGGKIVKMFPPNFHIHEWKSVHIFKICPFLGKNWKYCTFISKICKDLHFKVSKFAFLVKNFTHLKVARKEQVRSRFFCMMK